MMVTLLITGVSLNTINKALAKKTTRELSTTENSIRKESCALVYRTIPANVLILKKTILLATTINTIDLYKARILISDTIKLCFKTFANNIATTLRQMSMVNMIHLGTISSLENIYSINFTNTNLIINKSISYTYFGVFILSYSFCSLF